MNQLTTEISVRAFKRFIDNRKNEWPNITLRGCILRNGTETLTETLIKSEQNVCSLLGKEISKLLERFVSRVFLKGVYYSKPDLVLLIS